MQRAQNHNKDSVWNATIASEQLLLTVGQLQRLRNAIQEYEDDRWRVISTKVGNGFSAAACKDKAAELETGAVASSGVLPTLNEKPEEDAETA
jgi:hypothetical protein